MSGGRAFDPAARELMDLADAATPELERDLRNLEGLNRHFGAYRMAGHFFSRWMEPGEPLHLLDLATGYGDIPRFLVRMARKRGCPIRVTAVDAGAPILDLARRASAGYPEIDYVRGDIREPWAGPCPDVALCMLALHHFSRADAAAVMRGLAGLRAAGARGVLIGDLERSAFASAGIWLVTHTVYRDRMTRHDAALSARHAFSFSELREVASEAGWRPDGHRRFFPARQAIWMEAARGGDSPLPARVPPA